MPRLKSITGLLDKLLMANEFNEALKTIATLNNTIDDIILWGEGRNLNDAFGLDETETSIS